MQVNLTAWHIQEGEAPLPAPYDYFASSKGGGTAFEHKIIG